MTFDPCPHQITQIVLKAGTIIRELKGLPEETNITTLYNETAPLLGIASKQMSSSDADHLPAPHESVRPDGAPAIPLRKCPKCEKDAMQIFGLCPTCTDSENGKYKTKFECSECHYIEKSEKHMVAWLQEMGVDFRNQSKQSLGIKTITDTGIK